MRGALLALLLLAGVARAEPPSGAAPTFGSPFMFTEQGGEAIYRSVCAECHMQDGHGAAGAGAYPSLANDAHLASPGYAITVVVRGQRTMPPLGRSLTNEQVADVVGFIRSHFGNAYTDQPAAADVAALR